MSIVFGLNIRMLLKYSSIQLPLGAAVVSVGAVRYMHAGRPRSTGTGNDEMKASWAKSAADRSQREQGCSRPFFEHPTF